MAHYRCQRTASCCYLDVNGLVGWPAIIVGTAWSRWPVRGGGQLRRPPVLARRPWLSFDGVFEPRWSFDRVFEP